MLHCQCKYISMLTIAVLYSLTDLSILVALFLRLCICVEHLFMHKIVCTVYPDLTTMPCLVWQIAKQAAAKKTQTRKAHATVRLCVHPLFSPLATGRAEHGE